MAGLMAVNWPPPAASTMTVPNWSEDGPVISENGVLPEATGAELVADADCDGLSADVLLETVGELPTEVVEIA